jgi:hypothetical protein
VRFYAGDFAGAKLIIERGLEASAAPVMNGDLKSLIQGLAVLSPDEAISVALMARPFQIADPHNAESLGATDATLLPKNGSDHFEAVVG